MNFDTALRLVTATKEIFPASKNDTDSTIDLWLSLFGSKDDGLFETAIRVCWLDSKFFPTPAEINEAIESLQYNEQVKPKQISWEVKRDTAISDKAFKFIREGKANEYMKTVDITKLHQHAKYYFNEISEELVRKNYSEIIASLEGIERCSACRTGRNECVTRGYVTKMCMNPSGYITLEMQACKKCNN